MVFRNGKKGLAIIPVALLLFAFMLFSGQSVASQPGVLKDVNNISAVEASRILAGNPADIVILDVRTPQEYLAGHLPNAQNMDYWGDYFARDILSLPKDKRILVYCLRGNRTPGAIKILKEAGYNNIIHMYDGIEAWEKAELPVVLEKEEEQEQEQGN